FRADRVLGPVATFRVEHKSERTVLLSSGPTQIDPPECCRLTIGEPDRSSPVIWTQFSVYLPIRQSLAAILGGRCSCLHCPLDGRGTCKAWRIRVCCASGRGRRVTLEVSSKG